MSGPVETTIPPTFLSNQDVEYIAELVQFYFDEQDIKADSFAFSVEVTYIELDEEEE